MKWCILILLRFVFDCSTTIKGTEYFPFSYIVIYRRTPVSHIIKIINDYFQSSRCATYSPNFYYYLRDKLLRKILISNFGLVCLFESERLDKLWKCDDIPQV